MMADVIAAFMATLDLATETDAAAPEPVAPAGVTASPNAVDDQSMMALLAALEAEATRSAVKMAAPAPKDAEADAAAPDATADADPQADPAVDPMVAVLAAMMQPVAAAVPVPTVDAAPTATPGVPAAGAVRAIGPTVPLTATDGADRPADMSAVQGGAVRTDMPTASLPGPAAPVADAAVVRPTAAMPAAVQDFAAPPAPQAAMPATDVAPTTPAPASVDAVAASDKPAPVASTERTAAAPAPATTPAPVATAAADRAPAAAQAARPAASAVPRNPVIDRTEARMRKIAEEIERLSGGRITAPILSMKAESRPVAVEAATPAGTVATPPVAGAAGTVATPQAGLDLTTDGRPASLETGRRETVRADGPMAMDLRAGDIALAAPDAAPRTDAAINGLGRPAAPIMHDAAPVPTVSPPVPLDRLAEAVAAHAARRETRFDIRLDPPDMGQVDVRLHVRHDGSVRAHLVVERPETLDMMLRDQPQLQRQLEQNGLSVGSSGLEFSLQQHGRRQDQAAPMPGSAQRAAPVESDERVDPAAIFTRSTARAGGIDLRV